MDSADDRALVEVEDEVGTRFGYRELEHALDGLLETADRINPQSVVLARTTKDVEHLFWHEDLGVFRAAAAL
ncbi:MAG TPA: hypothetical protein VMJ35_00915 [Dongiaceae bacterium]|nr:hypothetical protein [Dongiaceae bacterium]